MKRVLTPLLAVLLTVCTLSARNLESDIKKILAKSPIARAGFAGVLVIDEKGRAVVAINSGHLFTPASNTKLFSTALALERLGPDKQFETSVEIRGKDLVLVGTGDANLSGRVMPYAPDSTPGPALAVIDDLAAQIAAHGIKTVDGDIVGDDTAFVYEPYSPTWTIQDIVDGDGPATSALVVNDNVIHVRITPPSTVVLDPVLPLFHLDAAVTAGTENKIELKAGNNPGVIQVRGIVKAGADVYSEEWSVGDPALFAAAALKDALLRRGIAVSGTIRALHRNATAVIPGETIARHMSLPLIEDLRLTSKISQNLHADLLLSDVAGSRTAGLQALSDFLTQIGIKPADYRFYDGSGLSRSTLVSPDAVVALLRYMAHSAHAEQWFTTLPVGGVDGSLEHRLMAKKTKGRIRAKTGTLAHVSALSGYAEAAHEKQLTFSIFINNSVADGEERSELIDRICAELVR